MTRLAEEMNVKRIYVSKALNELQSEGLIHGNDFTMSGL